MTSGLALPRGRGDTLLAQRFGAERRTSVVWVLLWVLGAAATFGALAPVLFRHVPFEPIDVAFRDRRGLVRRLWTGRLAPRPDNRSGLLMTATGFALFASPLLAQVDSPLAKTLALVLPDLWVLFFVPLVLTLLTGGRLRTVLDRVLVAAVLLEVFVLAPAWLMFAPEDGNLLLIVDDPGVAAALDTLQRVLFVAIPVGTALVLGARYRGGVDTGPSRAPARGGGSGLPAAVRVDARRAAHRRREAAAHPLGRHVLADHGAGRVPRGPAALAAGARGGRGPVPGPALDRPGRAAGRARPRAGRPAAAARVPARRRPRRRFGGVR